MYQSKHSWLESTTQFKVLRKNVALEKVMPSNHQLMWTGGVDFVRDCDIPPIHQYAMYPFQLFQP